MAVTILLVTENQTGRRSVVVRADAAHRVMDAHALVEAALRLADTTWSDVRPRRLCDSIIRCWCELDVSQSSVRSPDFPIVTLESESHSCHTLPEVNEEESQPRAVIRKTDGVARKRQCFAPHQHFPGSLHVRESVD